MAYEFKTLSPEDFESLVADLFSAEWGTRLESFKAGKDSGIDLRHTRVFAGKPGTIIQCKRYAPHKFTELRRSLLAEAEKLKILAPVRYIVATSVDLSPPNKSELLEILSPWCQSTGDIYGSSEINGLLRDHPQVEHAHFKLWIASTAVLERILNAHLFNFTDATLEQLQDELCRFVIHDGYNQAMRMLHEHHHVLIVGNPGIGKTTLARMLMCYYAHQGFEPISVLASANDAWSVLHGATKGGRKIVFLYDDFLGRLRFDSDRLPKNEEVSLLALLDRARKSDNLRLILTTREYILSDAQRVHGVLGERAREIAKYTLALGDYSRQHRAQILFNHLYFSDLPDSRLKAIVESRVYRDLVSHQHFNPRTVEGISQHANSQALSEAEYIRFVETQFSDPSQVWEHAFQVEIGPMAQVLLAILWSFGGVAEIRQLKDSAECLFSSHSMATDFEASLRVLDGNFIQTARYTTGHSGKGETHIVEFHNPSVADFLERLLTETPAWVRQLVGGVVSFSQVNTMLEHSDKIDQPREFWQAIRLAAERVEDRPSGYLINCRHYDNGPIRKIWRLEGRLESHRMRTLLRIERHTRLSDARSVVLKEMVSTPAGWTHLLESAENDNSVAYACAHLIKWIRDHSSWRSEQKSKVLEAFRTAVINYLADEESIWPISVDSVSCLMDTCAEQENPLSVDEQMTFARAAKAAVTTLLANSDASEELAPEFDALKQISKSCPAGEHFLRGLASSLEARLESARVREEDAHLEPRYEAASRPEIDLDALFAGLLDR